MTQVEYEIVLFYFLNGFADIRRGECDEKTTGFKIKCYDSMKEKVQQNKLYWTVVHGITNTTLILANLVNLLNSKYENNNRLSLMKSRGNIKRYSENFLSGGYSDVL